MNIDDGRTSVPPAEAKSDTVVISTFLFDGTRVRDHMRDRPPRSAVLRKHHAGAD